VLLRDKINSFFYSFLFPRTPAGSSVGRTGLHSRRQHDLPFYFFFIFTSILFSQLGGQVFFFFFFPILFRRFSVKAARLFSVVWSPPVCALGTQEVSSHFANSFLPPLFRALDDISALFSTDVQFHPLCCTRPPFSSAQNRLPFFLWHCVHGRIPLLLFFF